MYPFKAQGRIQAIIFDLDGVLVDAVDWHFNALNQALMLFGYSLSREEHEAKFNGLPTYLKLQKLSEVECLPVSLHPFINEMKQHFTLQIIKSRCHPRPEVSNILASLSAQGYALALCSNSNRVTVDTILDQMGIRDYFDIILSTNDIKSPKPNPEIYEQAFSLLNLEPENCLIVEDSEPGILAAKSSHAHVMEIGGPYDLNLKNLQGKIKSIGGFTRNLKAEAGHSLPIEIIVPMAGLGTRFSQAGYTAPKPLIPVLGKPMIQWVIENVRPKTFRYHFTFICNEEHLRTKEATKILKELEPDCTILSVKGVTAGAACTVLIANSRLFSSRPVVVVNSDQWVEFDMDKFIQDAMDRKSDGSILTFPANENKWSYARLDSKNDRVLEVAEKRVISPHATVGIYFFKKASELGTALKDMIRKNIRTNGEFYLCPVYNELIAKNQTIRIFEIAQHLMHGLGTPEDLTAFLEKNS